MSRESERRFKESIWTLVRNNIDRLTLERRQTWDSSQDFNTRNGQNGSIDILQI